MHRVGELAQLVLLPRQRGAHLGQAGVAGDPGGLGLLLLGGCAGHGCCGHLGGMAGGSLDGGGDLGLAPAALLAGPEPLAGSDLVAGRAFEGLGAAVQGPGALLGRAQREPDLGLGGPSTAGLELEPVALLRRGVPDAVGLLGLGLGLGEPALERRQLTPVGLEARREVGDGGAGALGLGASDPRGLS